MAPTAHWDEDTPQSEIADALPRRNHERLWDIGFRLLVAALVGGWLLMPERSGDPVAPAAQTSTR